MKKHQQGREIEFRITVKEFVTPPSGQHSKSLAEADKEVNQKSAAILRPAGRFRAETLADCMRMIRQFSL